ncbi:MAG TPA: ABC transporter ATP-binding protein [Stellaceae bacterium]|nr:ABC transporter ATP-binding protein [Stellaceae bacterium]
MLEARGLRKSFGALEATRDVSLALPEGARHAVVGPNGSGKTTLFNLLTGELRPDEGQVFLAGKDITALPPNARARAGLTRSFQKNNLFLDLTVRENLALALAIGERAGTVFWRRFERVPGLLARAEALAERVRLADVLGIPVRALPYGTQRQLEVGLALGIEPKVLLLDEPTAGMSAEETRAMTSLIAGLPREIAVLVIEHDMEVVFEIAERVTVLDYGRILAEGTPQEVRATEAVRRRYLGERAQ